MTVCAFAQKFRQRKRVNVALRRPAKGGVTNAAAGVVGMEPPGCQTDAAAIARSLSACLADHSVEAKLSQRLGALWPQSTSFRCTLSSTSPASTEAPVQEGRLIGDSCIALSLLAVPRVIVSRRARLAAACGHTGANGWFRPRLPPRLPAGDESASIRPAAQRVGGVATWAPAGDGLDAVPWAAGAAALDRARYSCRGMHALGPAVRLPDGKHVRLHRSVIGRPRRAAPLVCWVRSALWMRRQRQHQWRL